MAYSNALTDALDGAGIAYELLEHASTDRASDEAAALGLRPNEVAKTVVLTAGSGNVRVLLPASERIDMHKLRNLLDVGKELHLLNEEALGRDYPEFELGAVPPVGGRDDAVVADSGSQRSTMSSSRRGPTTARFGSMPPTSSPSRAPESQTSRPTEAPCGCGSRSSDGHVGEGLAERGTEEKAQAGGSHPRRRRGRRRGVRTSAVHMDDRSGFVANAKMRARRVSLAVGGT